ncbi:fibronectin type III domain-containing protein [Wenyingzhuangia sp. IMCC45574]
MINFKNLFIAIFLVSISSCSSGSSESIDDNGSVDEGKTPTLLFPLNDSECFEGTIVSETRSELKFEWNTTAFATSYILNIKNLNTGKESGFSSETGSKTVTIERGVPYSWNVIAIGERFSDQHKSTTWNFYNAGVGTQNHAPFPAKPIFPIMGSKTPRNLQLTWSAKDVDNDIKEYDVYFGIEKTSLALNATVASPETSLSNLNANTVYYWYIVTKDNHGNVSTSPVFEFKTE